MIPSSVSLLLASRSPRRRQLLAQLGVPLEFVDIEADEHLARPVPAPLVAEQTALLKAQAYSTPLVPHQVLVTADTVVVHRDQVLGKPHSRDEALDMLRNLSGDVHQVYTGVCLRTHNASRLFTERTDVHFLPLSQAEMEYYVDSFQPYDKAGSYGIQEWIGMVAISSIEGCYYNVMGLPVARLYHELESLVN